MIETLAALLFAHILADFVFQTDAMVANKRKPAMLLLHGVIVLLTAQVALGRIAAWELLALAIAHIAIDVVKVYALPDKLSSFFADQAAHLATIFAVALYAPTLFAGGLWANVIPAPALMTIAGGFILTTFAGAHVLRLLVKRWDDTEVTLPSGLPNGGRLIGILERGIIFMLVLTGNPAGVGFLIAAKSVLRFEATQTGSDGKDHSVGEYVIIGTLASFGWALAVSWATVAILTHLSPLGFLPLSP